MDKETCLRYVERFTVNQLKGILRELGVKCSGVKRELQTRLQQECLRESDVPRHDPGATHDILVKRSQVAMQLIMREATGGGSATTAQVHRQAQPRPGLNFGPVPGAARQQAFVAENRPTRRLQVEPRDMPLGEPFWQVERRVGVFEFEQGQSGLSQKRCAAQFELTQQEAAELRAGVVEVITCDDDKASASAAADQEPLSSLSSSVEDCGFDLEAVATRRLGGALKTTPARPLRCVAWAFRVDAAARDRPPVEQNWPLGTTLTANGTCLVLKRQRKVYAPCEGQERAKGFSEPMDVSRSCVGGLNRLEAVSRCEQLEPQYMNALRFVRLPNASDDVSATDQPRKIVTGPEFVKDELCEARYAMVVELVRDVPSARLARAVASSGLNPPLHESTRRALRFAGVRDDDDPEPEDEDVQMSAASFSLKCPLSLAHLHVPVRGRDCNHLQCFDLQVYLDLNIRISTMRFRCTICSRLVPPASLVVDAFALRLIDQYERRGEQPDSVEIDADGSVRAVTSGRRTRGDVDDSGSDGEGRGPPTSRQPPQSKQQATFTQQQQQIPPPITNAATFPPNHQLAFGVNFQQPLAGGPSPAADLLLPPLLSSSSSTTVPAGVIDLCDDDDDDVVVQTTVAKALPASRKRPNPERATGTVPPLEDDWLATLELLTGDPA